MSQVREMYEGSYLPLHITAKSGEKDYSGQLELTVCSASGNYLLYSRKFDITAGREHTALFAFPVHIETNMRLLLQYRTDENEILFTRYYPYSASLRGATRKELILGLVGQAPLNSGSRFEISEMDRDGLLCDVQSYLVDPESVTTDINSILCYDILYLSDDYLDTYSPGVIHNLINWAANGGILIVGGVVDKNREQRLEQLMIANVKQRNFTNFTTIAGQYYLLGDGIIYTYDYDYFSGYVYFNVQVHSMLRSALYNLPALLSERVLDMCEVDAFQEEIFEQLPSWRFGLPSFRRYMVIIMIYIFIALPSGYLLLRRIRKHYYLQGTILLFAFAFAVLIYVMGANSRMNVPHSSLLSIEESFGETEVAQRYLALQTLYNKKASFYLRPEDAFRLVPTEGTLFETDAYLDHVPDLSAYSMESYLSDNENHVRVGKTQSGLFRFMSNETPQTPPEERGEPLLVLNLEDGIPDGESRSLFSRDMTEFSDKLMDYIDKHTQNHAIDESTLNMLSSYLKAHAYRFEQGDYSIEVYKKADEDAAIVMREAEMIRSSTLRFKITEHR